jgi:hypothetical protein
VHTVLLSPNRIVALVLGVATAAFGAVPALTGRPVLGGLAIGVAAVLLVTAALGIAPARRANIGAGMAWLVVGYAGLFLIGTEFNVLGLTAMDEILLFAAATGHLAVGLGARRDAAASPVSPVR